MFQLTYETSNAVVSLYEKYKSLGLLSDDFINTKGVIIEKMRPVLNNEKESIDKARGNKTIES